MIKFKKKKIELSETKKQKDLFLISLEEASNYLNVGLTEIGNLLRKKEIELNVNSICTYKFKQFYKDTHEEYSFRYNHNRDNNFISKY